MLIKTSETIAVSDQISAAKQAKELMDRITREKLQKIVDSEQQSMINPDYGVGRPILFNEFERICKALNPAIIDYDHPFNPHLKFFATSAWPKGPHVLYLRGALPENSVYTFREQKIPKNIYGSVDKEGSTEKDFFDTVKVAWHLQKPSWKRALIQLMEKGLLTEEQVVRTVDKYGSSRPDARFAAHFG